MKENSTRRYRVPLLLPVRTKFVPLQTIKAWFYQLWQRWHTPRLRVQPPLQPGRHKPFPHRPHQQRRQAVFAALDAAPAGLTRRQLIAHVRTVTGIGCSEKLITQWRQERGGDGATERERDAVKGRRGNTMRRKRMVQLRLFLMCLLLGATMKPWHPAFPVAAQEITISPAPSASPTISSFPSAISNSAAPRLLRIKLTINAASDLLVKSGDEVKGGQVLTNRSHERQRLFSQRRVLATQVQQSKAQRAAAIASLALLEQRGAELPPLSFASEQAAITKAEAEAVTVNRTVAIQRQRVASFASLVAGEADALSFGNQKPETRNIIAAHETAKLTQAQDQQRLAQTEIELQRAKFTAAREARAYEEKKHRIELTRQLLAVRSQQQQAAIERARLTAQLAEVEVQLARFTAIRAPFAGTIKRIEWEEMHDENLTVLVYLVIGKR